MSKAPVVSIVTPAYNVASFIGATVESVLVQRFGDFELLVVDDGSTDDTAAIAGRYAQHDARIRLLQQANGGIAAARNAALTTARGRFIALLDSDDRWLPNYLEEQLRILHERPTVDILSANALNVGGAFDGEPVLQVLDGAIRRVPLTTLVEKEDSMCIMSIFRRQVYDAIGPFDERLRRSEDYDYWLRAAAAGFTLWINPTPLGLYRRRPDSLSSDEAVMLDAMREPLLKLRRRCLNRPALVAAVDRQLGRFAERSLVAQARAALVAGDQEALVRHLSALANTTGNARFRLAGWGARRVPGLIRLLYTSRLRLRSALPRARAARAHRLVPSSTVRGSASVQG